MKVLFLGHEASRSGSPAVLLSLVRWIGANRDWTIDVRFVHGGPLLSEFGGVARSVDVLHSKNRVVGAVRRAGLGRYLAPVRASSAGYDVVYVNGVPALAAVDGGRAPVILHQHELEFVVRHTLGSSWRRLVTVPNHFVVCSEAVAEYVRGSGVPNEKVTVAYEFLDAVPDAAPVPEKGTVLGSGWIGWRKGTDLFVQIAAEHARRGGTREFVWVGDGPKGERQDLEEEARKAGAMVRFVGPVNDPWPYVRDAAVLALTSREDPFPLTCLEAAAMSRPIVCFEGAGGMPEFVRQGAGEVVPYLSVGKFADAIEEVTAHSRMFIGRELLLERHTAAKVAPVIASVILSSATDVRRQ